MADEEEFVAVEVSVIVPTYNGAEKIPKCLESLLNQETDVEYEVIVMDDGSLDNTLDVVKKYDKVRLFTQENAGPSAARNHGVSKAAGDIVLFIDDDCIAEPDWLEKMVEPFKNKEIAGVKGAYLSRQKEFTARFVQIEYEEKYDKLLKCDYIDFIDTYSAGFRRDIFMKTGGFDLKFKTASVEDQEFSFRLADAGYKMVFIPNAKVWHRHIDSLKGYIRKKIKIGYWKTLIFVKNPNKIQGDDHTPATLKLQVLLAAAMLPAAVSFVIKPWAPLVLPILFILTTIPLTVRCLFRDRIIGVLSPMFIACRAFGLTTGLIKGFFDHIIFHKSKK
jgi:GT2 family glycosyltransferase